MPPAKYFIFAILLAGALGALGAATAPARGARGWRGRGRRLLCILAAGAGLVCVDVGLRYVQGSWPDLWLPDTTHRLLLYGVILAGAAAVAALAPGGRATLLLAQLAGLGACLFILLTPLKRDWGAAELGLIVAGWTALGSAAFLSSQALLATLSKPAGVASLTALPIAASAVLFLWGHDATQSMTAGGLFAMSTGFVAVSALRRFRGSDAWLGAVWWGVLTLAIAGASHFASLAPVGGAMLLAAPAIAAIAALPAGRGSVGLRATLAGAGLAAGATAGVVFAWLASGASTSGYGH